VHVEITAIFQKTAHWIRRSCYHASW